jgi:hypothetical protein
MPKNSTQCNDDEKRRLKCMNHGGDQLRVVGESVVEDMMMWGGVVMVMVGGHPSLLDPGLPDR